MVWLTFLVASVVIVIAAMQLAKYGDTLALRTNLGQNFVGIFLIAMATSLPEVLTTISAILQGVPEIAAGNLIGSNLFNMFMLAILDLVFHRQRILRKVALRHALTGSLTVFIIGLVVFFMMADLDLKIGWVGIDSLLIIATYFVSMRLIRASVSASSHGVVQEIPPTTPSLRSGLIGFGISTLVLVVVTPILVSASADIAEITGLGGSFIGITLVAIVTSMPELVTTIAAARIGAEDMAIGNLFGSNLFNMLVIGLADFFYLGGRFLGVVSADLVVIGMLSLLMTAMALIGNLARLERRFWIVELDALALIVMYALGVWFMYRQGGGV
jgi:cation:H+ antiporter